MSKFVTTTYSSPKEITKFDHYVSIGVTVDDTGVAANSDGKKIVPAGTILGTAGANSILSDDTMKAKDVNNATDAAKAEGVLLTDVDVTYGSASGSMVIHGFIDLNKIVAPQAAAVTALAGRVLFIK